MIVRLYVGSPLSDCPSLCCERTAPEVSVEEGSYALLVFRKFSELSFTSRGSARFDTLAQLLA